MKTLVVEDDRLTAQMLLRILRQLGHEVTIVDSGEEALAHLNTVAHELIVIDLGLEGIKGDKLCQHIRRAKNGSSYYIVGTTASEDVRDIESLLQAGADDYLAKPFTLESARVRLRIALSQAQERLHRNEAESRLAYLATHDSLTRLISRNQLKQSVEALIGTVRDGEGPGAILSLDLDNFKLVNDSFGHAAGDKLLRRVADTLQLIARPSDVAVRAGGDEFVLILPNTRAREAMVISELIRQALEEMAVRESDRTIAISACVGVCEVRARDSANELLRRADTACYEAKIQGRNRVVLFSGTEIERRRLRRDVGWHAKIRDAINDERLVLHYQPVVSLATNAPAHYEVLVRLLGRKGRLHLPGAFLPAAERFHLMPQIDRYVLSHALREMAQRPELTCSINLAGPSMNDPKLPGFLIDEAQTHGVHPSRVILEVTESEVIGNMAMARRLTAELREHEFRFSLDDFGAGFSSFNYLKHLPVEFLKIDGHFIRDITTDPTDLVFVRAMNEIAHHMGLASIAEWVQDEATLDLLHEIGVDYVQGTYLSPGKPLEEESSTTTLTPPEVVSK